MNKATNSNAHTVITVKADQSYPVHVGRRLDPIIAEHAKDYASVLLVYSPDVVERVTHLESLLRRSHDRVALHELPRGEAAKTVTELANGWDAAHRAGIARDGIIIAVGGGATTDLGGFMAASWMRGIDVIHVPTTLLAMVDAAIGGKTGINTAGGKNLVGAFHHPVAVICDLDWLDTLPVNDVRSGLAEAIKCGFIQDRRILEIVDSEKGAILDPRHPSLPTIIERSIQVKANVVSNDFRETGMREILNYGHTCAHAIELVEEFRIRHGEAVAIGCVFAAELSEAEGIARRGLADLHRTRLEAIGLPVTYDQGIRQELLSAMYSDKKVRNGKLRFVVLSDIANPMPLDGPRYLDRAFDAIGVS